MTLAHAVYALLEEAGLGKTPDGTRIRRCALMVPSAIEDAFVDVGNLDPQLALDRAEDCLSSLRSALSNSLSIRSLPLQDVEDLLSEIETLETEITILRHSRQHDSRSPA
ncbi:MAG: hypothetical protein L6R30_12145 [Thermoanaerobaculia bacterium]|nr:hypothetical protein [Thermoanaerobaculia bacterium]